MTIKAFIHLQLCNKITVLIILFKKVLHYALLSKSHISLDQLNNTRIDMKLLCYSSFK